MENRPRKRPWLWVLLFFVAGIVVAPLVPRLLDEGLGLGRIRHQASPSAVITAPIPTRHEGFAAGIRPARFEIALRQVAGTWTGEAPIWLHNQGTIPVVFSLMSGNDEATEMWPEQITVAPGRAARGAIRVRLPHRSRSTLEAVVIATAASPDDEGAGRIVLEFPLQVALQVSNVDIQQDTDELPDASYNIQ